MSNNASAASSSSNCSNNFEGEQTFAFRKIMCLSRSVVQITLMLPLALYVLYHGHRRWKPHKTLKNVSHSDFFAYNMALAQLLNTLGTLVSAYGLYTSSYAVIQAGGYIYCSHFVTELLIHCLTCVDRYLAIVKPIFYLKLKQSLGIVVRNVFIGIVWLLSLLYVGLVHLSYPNYPFSVLLGTLVITFLIVSFCSVYVLCVLRRPGPGDRGPNKIDRSKLKAFQTIMAVMVVVLIWVIGILVSVCLEDVAKINLKAQYVTYEAINWLSLPSSLVLLVLYFQRTVKCTCGK